jgi:GDP-D-mannose dehydratase
LNEVSKSIEDLFAVYNKIKSVPENLADIEKINKVNIDFTSLNQINENLIRPSKTTTLIGDISKAEKMFNFKNEYSLDSLIKLMLSNDLIENGLDPKDYFND